jgi:hypothetical protein
MDYDLFMSNIEADWEDYLDYRYHMGLDDEGGDDFWTVATYYY